MFVPQPGALVGGRFELTSVIGRGGMGEIWKARDTQLDCACAVKFILQHLAHENSIRLRFTREAKAVAQLHTPHAVHILGVGAEQQMLYLAMELLHGETLETRLKRDGPLSQRDTVRLLEQVADALEKAHAAGIVHRDLKPANIWLWSGKELFVKVLDFGVAKVKSSTSSLHTATGSLVGTPYYMSPEQARGVKNVDARSDVWSLAIIAVECMTRARPFESEGLGDLLMKIVVGPIPPIHELGPDLPPSLQSWWERALARDPEQRFQTASELVEALRLQLDLGAPSSLHQSGAPPQGPVHNTLRPLQSGTFPPPPLRTPRKLLRWSALSVGALVAVSSIIFGSRALRGSGSEAAPAPGVAPPKAATAAPTPTPVPVYVPVPANVPVPVPAPAATPPAPVAPASDAPASDAPASDAPTSDAPAAPGAVSAAVPDVPVVKVAGGPAAPTASATPEPAQQAKSVRAPREPAPRESAPRQAAPREPSPREAAPPDPDSESAAAPSRPRPTHDDRLELPRRPAPPDGDPAKPPRNDNAARLGLD